MLRATPRSSRQRLAPSLVARTAVGRLRGSRWNCGHIRPSAIPDRAQSADETDTTSEDSQGSTLLELTPRMIIMMLMMIFLATTLVLKMKVFRDATLSGYGNSPDLRVLVASLATLLALVVVVMTSWAIAVLFVACHAIWMFAFLTTCAIPFKIQIKKSCIVFSMMSMLATCITGMMLTSAERREIYFCVIILAFYLLTILAQMAQKMVCGRRLQMHAFDFVLGIAFCCTSLLFNGSTSALKIMSKAVN